jgi:hypothetical protein
MTDTIARHFRAHRYRAEIVGETPVYAAYLLIVATSAVLISIYGMPFPASTIYTNLDLYPKGFGLFLVCDGTIQLWKHRPDRPIRFLRLRYSDPQVVRLFVARLPLLFVFIAFLPLFALLKPLIPLVSPYTWDATLIEWDRAIFGTDPWRLLQPVLGYPIITAVIAILYHAWIALVYPGSLVFLYAKRAQLLRRQYFLSFMLVWILGGFVLAAGMSSVGPCFLEPIMGDSRFSDQMAYLNAANEQIPIVVLDVQNMLLSGYTLHGPGHGAGITAMPSMHVAIAFLFWLAIRRFSAVLDRWFFGFFLAIWIASVHLAYHYAVDGLVSIVLVWIAWRTSGWVFAWWDARAGISPSETPPASGTNVISANSLPRSWRGGRQLNSTVGEAFVDAKIEGTGVFVQGTKPCGASSLGPQHANNPSLRLFTDVTEPQSSQH